MVSTLISSFLCPLSRPMRFVLLYICNFVTLVFCNTVTHTKSVLLYICNIVTQRFSRIICIIVTLVYCNTLVFCIIVYCNIVTQRVLTFRSVKNLENSDEKNSKNIMSTKLFVLQYTNYAVICNTVLLYHLARACAFLGVGWGGGAIYL